MNKACTKKLEHQGKHFGHFVGKKFVPCPKLHHTDLTAFEQILKREVERVKNGQ